MAIDYLRVTDQWQTFALVASDLTADERLRVEKVAEAELKKHGAKAFRHTIQFSTCDENYLISNGYCGEYVDGPGKRGND